MPRWCSEREQWRNVVHYHIRATLVMLVMLSTWELHGGEPGKKPVPLQAGFAQADLTPPVGDKHKPVFIAGFGHGRKATGVHDPILARTVVLQEADHKLAIVSVDLVGYFHPHVDKIRTRLPGFTYVLVTSTHNHEGPDTLGLWGQTPFQSGVDPDYMKLVEDRIVASVQDAAKNLQPVHARIGTARDGSLLHDGREPYIKHDELVA